MLRKEWGGAFDERMQMAKAASSHFGSEGLVELLNQPGGLGNTLKLLYATRGRTRPVDLQAPQSGLHEGGQEAMQGFHRGMRPHGNTPRVENQADRLLGRGQPCGHEGRVVVSN